jgi:uncharacterized protein YnzC (UPF0291/DUF896 family)
LPVWQHLFDELKDYGFMVFAVAMDSRGAEIARPWIEAAKTTYVSVIDTEHRVADLYNMVNVPEAVWIDEAGRIVRPTEVAGSGDYFRKMDRVTRTLPEEGKRMREEMRTRYMDALRDWVKNGIKSAYAFDPAAARAHVRKQTDDMALAHCWFRLGRHLHATGKVEEAEAALAEASRLHPDSWNIWRQMGDMKLEGKPNPDFWARVDTLGSRRYYDKIDMPGMP